MSRSSGRNEWLQLRLARLGANGAVWVGSGQKAFTAHGGGNAPKLQKLGRATLTPKTCHSMSADWDVHNECNPLPRGNDRVSEKPVLSWAEFD